MIIDGKKIAAEILAQLRLRPTPKKFLAGVLIGENPASASFQKLKEKTAKELGIDYRIYRFAETGSNDSLRAEVGKIAAHKTCGGILVQLPLPKNLNTQYILNAIPKEKDVDVLSERTMGAFYANRGVVLPPAVATVEEIVKLMKLELKTMTAAVVGPGFLIGRPVALWLMNRVKELCVLGRGSDYESLKRADLVVLGVGQAGLIKPEMLKDGAGVIDFGYSQANNDHDNDYNKGELRGDFDTKSSSLLSSLLFYTPTPGGTGPILVAKLLENFYTLNRNNP